MSATTTAPNPFPYLQQGALERRLDDVEALKEDYSMTDSEWSQLVTEIIAEESAWVHGIITDNGITPTDSSGTDEFLTTYPTVRQAMVRLCRSAIHDIEEDGLTSESIGDHSEDYRPASEIRAEVRALLETATPDGGGTGPGGGGDGFRSTII